MLLWIQGEDLWSAPGRNLCGLYPAVRAAVQVLRVGLTALAGWSATMSGNRIQTWNGKPLSPGEIVILPWVLGWATSSRCSLSND